MWFKKQSQCMVNIKIVLCLEKVSLKVQATSVGERHLNPRGLDSEGQGCRWVVPEWSGCLVSAISALGSGSASGFLFLSQKSGGGHLGPVCLGSYKQKAYFANQEELQGAGCREAGVLSCLSWPARTRYSARRKHPAWGVKGGLKGSPNK